MKARVWMVLGVVTLIAGCGPRDEFPHQTIEAYQADATMRSDILQKCADHITAKRPFATEADSEECRKAYSADQNVRLAAHQARAQAASNAALNSAAKQFEGK